MSLLYLVRHGRATAGWNVDPDPGLDDLGAAQAAQAAIALAPHGEPAIVSSPLKRCLQTAAVLAGPSGAAVEIVPAVGEIPSPEGVDMVHRVEWLRWAMTGTWSSLGERYTAFREGVGDYLASLTQDTVVVSHFVAINAAIGLATNDDRVLIASLDNCSITTLEVVDGSIRLVQAGHEADTLIR